MDPFRRLIESRWRWIALAGVVVVVLAGAAAAGTAIRSGDDGDSTLSTAGGGFATGSNAVASSEPVAPQSASQESKAFAGDASVDSPGAAPAPGTTASFDLLGRQIIRSGSMEIEVDSVVESFERVQAVAIAAGGYVSDSSFFGRADEQSARLTLRVPADRFDDVVQELRAIAVEVISVSTNAQDVTAEVTDLESSLRNLRAVESQYLDLLGRARAIGEILQVQDRLNQTRLEIDRLEGRIAVLGRLTELSTLSVFLQPVTPEVTPVDETSGPLGAAGEAWDASLATLSAIATVAIVVAVYSWWLVPVLIVLALAGRGGYRRWMEGRPAGSPADAQPIDSAGDTA